MHYFFSLECPVSKPVDVVPIRYCELIIALRRHRLTYDDQLFFQIGVNVIPKTAPALNVKKSFECIFLDGFAPHRPEQPR